MGFEEIRLNNRVQIEYEKEGNSMCSIRGLIILLTKNEVVIVTEFGEIRKIKRSDILSVVKISFDRRVSEAIVAIKNYYLERIELEERLNDLKEQEDSLIRDLYDANFLSKFSVEGAKNRLEKSIDRKLLEFKRNDIEYYVYFSENPNNQIEIVFKATNVLEYYNAENVKTSKLVSVYAPDEADVIEQSFGSMGIIKELEKNAVHEKDNIYNVFSVYVLYVDIDEDNFLKKREEIIEGLKKMTK